MFGARSSTIARRGLVLAAATAVACMLGSGIAAADVPVNNYLNWNGVFPIIGKLDPITTQTVTTLPSPVKVGVQSANFPVSITVTAPALAGTGLRDVQAATLQGTASVTVSGTDSAGQVYTETVPLTIPSTPTPAAGQALTFNANGSAFIPAIAHAGSGTMKVTAASTTLDPKKADGTDTVLKTFTVKLNLDATGPSQNPTNNPTLGTIVAQ
ncbi:MAG TPA: DUF6801 domain-containing protein [Pseudonocardiaceae bacterium]|nr:DUF6801 domain-containing protein [Pseudonocardiaceae bacterium]